MKNNYSDILFLEDMEEAGIDLREYSIREILHAFWIYSATSCVENKAQNCINCLNKMKEAHEHITNEDGKDTITP